MRHFFHIIRPRSSALVLLWAVAGLLAVWPEAGASIDTGPVAVESSITLHRGPVALRGAVKPALDFGYGEISADWSDPSGQGAQLRGAEGIRKRISRRYRLSAPDAVPDCHVLAPGLLFEADALGPFAG